MWWGGWLAIGQQLIYTNNFWRYAIAFLFFATLHRVFLRKDEGRLSCS